MKKTTLKNNYLVFVLSILLFFQISEKIYGENINAENLFTPITQQVFEDRVETLRLLQESYSIADCTEEKQLQQKIYSHRKAIIADIKTQAGIETTTAFMMPDPIPCPEMQVIELLGVPGFAETDELVICGAPDTLAFLIFIEEPGTISGTQMSATFLPGMQYAGFELTHYGSGTISNLDPNPSAPKFLLEGITNGVYIGYIGVEATCDANINAFEYEVDLDFSFIYEDTLGNFQKCRQSVTPIRTYNSVIKDPVLNYRNVPITTINSLSTEFCTNIQISQDGIDAYLTEVEFSICNVDFSNEVQLNSISANGTPIPYTYNAADSTVKMIVSDNFFLGNSNANPVDTLFNESEFLNMQVCMQVDECPTVNTQFINYKTAYYCHGDTCQVINRASEIRVRPNDRPVPIATSNLIQIPGVCGAPAIMELTLKSSVLDSAGGIFTDLSFGFETCDQSALDISKVTIGGTEITADNYEWIDDDLNIDLTTLTSDPDGIGNGITDADGDGFFDDLPGGRMLTVRIELDFICALPPDAGSIACSSLDCSFAQFYVRAKRDCGQAFSFEPNVEDFSITNGATYVNLGNQDLVSNSYFAYNFGNTRTTGNTCASPIAPKVKTVEFCYVYERENIEPCPAENTTNELQVLFDGNPLLVNDIVFVPSSGSMTVNGVTTQSNVTGTFTDLAPDQRLLSLPIGELNVGDTVCYIYQIEADSASCTPPIYMNGTHQVIETCTTDGCTCKTVKACDVALFRSDPSNCGCECDIASGANIQRWNLGYTDETMTEKVKIEDVPIEDRTRFLPCDTMYYEGWMTFNSPESVGELYQWYFVANITNIGSNGWGGNDDTELMIDASGTELLGLDFAKQGGAGKVPIDISSFSDCLDNPNTTGSTGFFAYAAKTPWDDVTYNTPMCNSGYEYHDGNLFGVYFRNFNKLEDCRGTETASWEEVDCLDQIKEAFNIEIGDTIYMRWLLPLTKNVKAAANEIANPDFTYRDPQILNVATGHFLDEFDSDCLLSLSNCRENSPFQTFCPEGINAVTEMTLDDCGGQVEHSFNVVTTSPVNWFTAEYRPFFTLEDIQIPMYSPLIYCGNAKIVTKGGLEYPLNVQSMTNHSCATVDGQEYCTVSEGDIGTLTFNPEADGYPGLGVGLGGYVDDFKIVYDLCKICPSETPDFSNYEITYDYRTCETLNGNCFRCNQSTTGTSNELPNICGINGSALVDRLGYYYNVLELDTLFRWEDVTSGDVVTTDISNGFPELTQEQDRNLLSSTSPGSSEELNTITVCADGTDSTLETHMGMLASITLTNSVVFTGGYDAAMNPLLFDTVSVSPTTTTYAVFLPDLAPGECTEFKIGTSLLFCPTPPDVPEICITTTSGCMGRSIMAALAGETQACNSIETCYQYVFEESGIQADFLTPIEDETYALCDTIPMAVLVKNVKTTTLTDIVLDIDLPLVGMEIISGSFEASYPNSGDFSLPFYSIVDPAINGNNLIYTEDNDFSNAIHSNGLPGVTSAADSNYVLVRFFVETKCDEFISGSQATFVATATDPCSPDILSSGIVTSNQMIINGADPADYGQVLITAKPSEAFCGQETPTFKITGQNISEQPLGDSVTMCITLPTGLTYRPGSMRYIIPTSLDVGTEIITDINGQTQICFQGFENMPIGGAFTLNFEADFDTDAICGDYDIQVDTKNLVEDESCTDGGLCDVYVQSSVNPTFTLTLKGPLETTDIQLFKKCTGTDDPVTICYEATLRNPGPDYMGDVSVNLHDDILGDNILDFYDPILGGDTYNDVFVASGDSITLTGCYTVTEINACPIILDMVYDSECTCNHLATPYASVEPEFTAMLPPTTVLCPGQELGIEICGDNTLTFNPASNVNTRTVGDSTYISVIDNSIVTQLYFSGGIGECTYDEIRFIRGVEEFDLDISDSITCQNQVATLELSIPIEYQDYVEIQWSPTTNLDDPNRIDPDFLSDTPGMYCYEVALTFNGGCVRRDSVKIEVKPVGQMTISGDNLICAPYETNTLNTNPGYDYYEWYLLNGGFEIIKASTPTEEWTGPIEPGKYIVKGFRSTDLCPSASDTIMIMQDECIDLELEKNVVNIPTPFIIGSQITYELVVCNKADPALDPGYDAFDVQVADQLPGGVTYVSHTQTTGNYSPTQNDWDISVIENGTCDTLWIDVTVEDYGCTINEAQITKADKEDIDSTPNNDDGNQSEDDEDNGKVVLDTFDLALTKKLSPMQAVPVTIGSTVTYDIEVCNQGQIDAYNVEVVDYVPTGMAVTDPNWTVGSVANEYFQTIPGPITVGNCQTIKLVTEVTSIPTSGSYINYAEINKSQDSNGDSPPDIDSTPDNDPANDGAVEDDATDNTNGDEDDHDPAEIKVIMVACQIANNSFVCPETALVMEEIGMNNVRWNWSGPNGFTSTTQGVNINPPIAGTYAVTVTDNNGLTTTCEVEIGIHPEMTLTTSLTNPSCFKGTDGAIDLTVTGGTGPFTFDWTNDGPDATDDDTEDINNLEAGTYGVIVTDANGCIKETKVTLTHPDELGCRVQGTDLLCNGDNSGSMEVQARGGTLPYEYSLDGAPYQPGTSFTGVAAGMHTVTVKDANGCTSTCELTLKEPELLSCSIKATDDSSCITNNGSIETIPTGGTSPYEFSIDGTTFQRSSLFSNLGAGDYTLTVKDANGCITTCRAILSEPRPPVCTITTTENVTCKNGTDGSLIAEGSSGSGDFEFSLDGMTWQTAGTFDSLTAGTYTVTIRNVDTPTCTSTCTTIITEPTVLSCSLTGTNISCNGGSDGIITVAAIGGLGNYEYSIDGGATWQLGNTFTGLPIGDYTVQLRDNDDINCITSCDITLREPPVLAFTTNVTQVACNGDASGVIFVTPTGGTAPYEYSLNGMAWQPGNIYANLTAGNQVITVRDAQGCILSSLITITEPSALSCTIVSTNATNCGIFDGTIIVNAVGGVPTYEYSIDGTNYQASNSFTGLMAGSYIISVRDENDCISTCSVTITTPDAPYCQISAVTHVECFGDATGSFTVIGTEGNPPYEFSLDSTNWQPTGAFNNLTAGQYTIYIRNIGSTNCISMCAVEIEQPTQLTCQLIPTDPLCKDGTDGNITVLATEGTPGYEYSLDGNPWQPDAVFSGLVAGDYSITIRDANNCTTTCEVTLSEPPLLTCTTTVVDLLCKDDGDGIITVTGMGGTGNYEYNIDGGAWQTSNIFSSLSGGDYVLNIRDEHNCISTCTARINEPTTLVCKLVEVVPESCAFNDGSIEVMASGGTGTPSYSIDGGATTQATGLFTGLTLGIYTITIQDENNCISTCSFEILPDCYDLALVKNLATPGPYSYGQKVVFDIEVINQGNINATNVEITDHVPCGFSYDPSALINVSNNWTPTATAVPMSVIANLPAQTRDTLQIELIVQECTNANGHTNEAEISSAFDENGNPGEDVDSTTDYDPNNDVGGEPNGPTDDQEDGDGTVDEDDHDPAFVEIYDLALTKKLVTPAPYAYGDILEFSIEICNQAASPVQNIIVSDYVPVGYSYDASLNVGWTGSGPTPTTLNYKHTTPLLHGADCITIPLFLKLEMSSGIDDWKNIGEISSFEDENGNPQNDVDSTPDSNPNNDGDMEDNVTDGTNGDEDDSDPAGPEIIDIALIKTTTDTGPFVYGDTIVFDIQVFNQGNVDLYNTVINDFIPCGYRYLGTNSSSWMFDSGTGIASTTLAGPIVAGDSTTVSIVLEVQACEPASTTAWTNIAEIDSFEDKEGEDRTDDDIDSDADGDPTNDPTDDNTNDNNNGDEDDNDPETIVLFDLAQIKQVATPGPYAYGDIIEYEITVINQGNVAAQNILIYDHIPTGLIYDPSLNSIWSGAAPTVNTTISSILLPGESTTVSIFLSLAPNSAGNDNYTNYSEIGGSEDGDGNDTTNSDVDSTPDNDPSNDGGGEPDSPSDDQTNGDGTNDEDDHDPAVIDVFDLALKKTTSAVGPFAYGDVITFDFTVYNQGNVPSTNIEITEQTPCGYAFDAALNPDWLPTGSSATTIISDTLQGGDSIIVSINFIIQACADVGAWKNTGEISGSQDDEGNDTTDYDIDSDADNDPTNDGDMEDDATDNENGDEDDSDFEEIQIFDLALIKQLAPTQRTPVLAGYPVEYQMTIFNQGNVDAYDITVVDYIPEGLRFRIADNTNANTGNVNDWMLVGSLPTYTIDYLPSLGSVNFNILFTIEPDFRGESITNFGEITHGSDKQGGSNTPDADSVSDDDEQNDTFADDDDINGDSKIGQDEDDHDPAVIFIIPIEDIVIIGDTSITVLDTIVTDTISDIDPEATPVFEEEIEEVVDCSKFPAYCYHGLAIELMPMGMVETWASDISVNDFSQCPDYQLGLWHESMPMKQPTTLAEVRALPTNLVFTCATLGNQEVQLYITDPEGNWNFCETYINVQDNNKGCVATQSTDATNALLGGQVNTWKGDAVQEVLLSTTQIDYMTTHDGFYHFELPMEESYTVTPQKNHIPLNGVSTFDLVLMTKHILGVQPFDNPYQWIAADVNQSKTVTAFDLVQLRKMILAIDTEFTNNTSWRFVEANYEFTTDNPLSENFPEQAHISNLSNNMVMDFVAIKIGDINGNVRPNAFHQATPRNSAEVFEIQVADQFLKAGQTYEIDLRAKDISKIQGYQFTVNTKNIMIDQIHGALMTTENFGLNNLDAGRITVSWNQQPNYLVSEEKLFTIQLQATKDTRMSEVLRLNSHPTVAEAYDLEDNIMEVQLQFTNYDSTTDFDLAQNQPNPFRNQTSIGYTLPVNSSVELILRDEAGRVIQVIKQDGKAGYNVIQLNELETAPGFIYYQLITKFGTKSKKMIRVE